MEAVKVTGGNTNPLKEQRIDELGSAMATLFAKQYSFLSEKERVKTFFAAIQMNAHLFSGECRSQDEHDELMACIEHEARSTVELTKSFLVS